MTATSDYSWAEIETGLWDRADHLVAELRTRARPTYAQWPLGDEIDALAAAVESRQFAGMVAEVVRLNRLYQDGWGASAMIAGMAHQLHTAVYYHGGPSEPVARRFPAESDVGHVMARGGCSQRYAVEMLGGKV